MKDCDLQSGTPSCDNIPSPYEYTPLANVGYFFPSYDRLDSAVSCVQTWRPGANELRQEQREQPQQEAVVARTAEPGGQSYQQYSICAQHVTLVHDHCRRNASQGETPTYRDHHSTIQQGRQDRSKLYLLPTIRYDSIFPRWHARPGDACHVISASSYRSRQQRHPTHLYLILSRAYQISNSRRFLTDFPVLIDVNVVEQLGHFLVREVA